MKSQEKQSQLHERKERVFSEQAIQQAEQLEEDDVIYQRWTFEKIYQQVSLAVQSDSTIRTMNDYKTWRASLGMDQLKYPSVDTIYRLGVCQLEQIKELFSQGRTGRPLKWNEEKIWECLKKAYQQSKIEDCPFSPKYYRGWQQRQEEATPSYSTINELIGSFKEIRKQLDVQDGRFAQDSIRPKRWTEDLVWGFLKQAYRDLTTQELEFTQQAFIRWREGQVEQNIRVPALSTIKAVLGGGGFSSWKERLITQAN